MTCRRLWPSGGSSSLLLVVLLLSASSPSGSSAAGMSPSRSACRLIESLRAEIAAYRPVVDRVLRYARDERGFRGRTWTELAEFTDTFGNRLAGTPNLEASIDYAVNKLKAAGLDNVHTERVNFTGWQRY